MVLADSLIITAKKIKQLSMKYNREKLTVDSNHF